MKLMNNQEKNPEQIKLDQEKRYVIGWEQVQERQIVFIWDKFTKRIVFKCNTRNRKICYPYIEKYYDKDNCVAPKEMRICLFE